MGACARAASPFVFGHLFALGTAAGHGPFPFDVSMPFALSMLSMGCCALLVTSTPAKAGEAVKRVSTVTKVWTCSHFFGRRASRSCTASTASPQVTELRSA